MPETKDIPEGKGTAEKFPIMTFEKGEQAAVLIPPDGQIAFAAVRSKELLNDRK